MKIEEVETKSYWLWYPGDFEIYHGMQQNFSREERGFYWPAYWKIDDCRKNLKFMRTYQLGDKTSFQVYSHSRGYVRVNGKKYRFGETIHCLPGKQEVLIFAGLPDGVPSVYVEGQCIYSDGDWYVSDYVNEPVKVGYHSDYRKKEQNPSVWDYHSKEVWPVEIAEMDGGVLYDFGRELTATIKLQFAGGFQPVMLCYGESVKEALDIGNCYYSQRLERETDDIPLRAFRYIYVPQIRVGELELKAIHRYVDIPVKAVFTCEDTEINRIWAVSGETFQLCSGIFFIDGIKRDRWIWSGDAYQSYFVNQYLMFDESINKRTMWALRGNDPIGQHINTILDYSMYWIISIWNHYKMSGDLEFVRAIYPKMHTMMEFLESQLDEKGFIIGREHDWVFIDWADIDKTGAVCAEQMLLERCYLTMARIEILLGAAAGQYEKKAVALSENIDRYFWDGEKQAYIDSFQSGRRHISRHANIFALIFERTDEEKRTKIYQHVLMNAAVPPITTPYFKFYELEALCKMGELETVKSALKDYWGGMLAQGAVTFWEEYDPEKQPQEQYEMYGDPYGKSMCHAWGASPVYLIGRYFMGIRETDVAYRTFEIRPELSLFSAVACEFPVKDGMVKLRWDRSEVTVFSSRPGGVFWLKGEPTSLEEGREYRFKR